MEIINLSSFWLVLHTSFEGHILVYIRLEYMLHLFSYPLRIMFFGPALIGRCILNEEFSTIHIFA